MSSLDDDLAEIDRSKNSSYPLNNKEIVEEARCESIGSGSVETFDSSNYEKGGLVVGLPDQVVQVALQATNGHGAGAGKAKQRSSVSLNPIAMGALAGLHDSDLDDSDDDKDGPTEKPVSPPHVANPKASGGPDHRPLVGGFAAAAYEAARADYYKKQGVEVRIHNPPRPRSRHPYP